MRYINKLNLQDMLLVAGLILFAAIFKLVPHLPNFSPELVFVALIGARFSKSNQFLFVLLLLIVCDSLYSLISPFSAFGSWTFMTYSGFLLIGLAANILPINIRRWNFVGFSISAAALFWTWTNFMVWFTGVMYPHTGAGLATCFVAGLPFLGYSLLSATVWSVGVKYALPHTFLRILQAQ